MAWIRRNGWWLLGILLLGGLASLLQHWRIGKEHRHDGTILAVGRRYDMDPAIIKAVIWQESRFNARARGTKGELGLMQLREEAAREWANAEGLDGFDHDQMLHPVRNIMAGTWYLHKQLRRFARADDPVPYALAAYNAGPSNAGKWSKGASATNSADFVRNIGFPSTQEYVQAILKRRELYANDFPANAK